MMDRTESERVLAEREQMYIAELKDTLGFDLKPDILEVMVELYRAGWRDCRRASEKGEI